MQPTDERRGNHVVIAAIQQSHLALKITDIVFKTLPGLHFDREEVISILLQLSSRSVLVIESLFHLFEGSK